MAERVGANGETRRRSQIVSGLVARMRDWFARAEAPPKVAHEAAPVRETASVRRIGPLMRLSSERSVTAHPADAGSHGKEAGALARTVVALPVSRRQQLTQLAWELRRRFGTDASDHDPLLLTLTSLPRHLLQIDKTAHVEVLDEPLPYRVVLGSDLSARVILETADFAEAHNFVVQYLLLTRDAAGGSA